MARYSGPAAAGGAWALGKGAVLSEPWVRRQPPLAPSAQLAHALGLRLQLERCGSSELSAPPGGRASPSA